MQKSTAPIEEIRCSCRCLVAKRQGSKVLIKCRRCGAMVEIELESECDFDAEFELKSSSEA